MSEAVKREIDAAEVIAWLREHPTFFIQHPEVALSIELPRENGSATSLASYQLEVLREKNRELNRRLQELFANANENERLTVRTHHLGLALLRANGLEETLASLVASLREDFNSQWVRLILFLPAEQVPESPWWRALPSDAEVLEPFFETLKADEPVCGRLKPEKLEVLFGAEASQVASAALVPLGRVGLLSIGSSDSNRFYPGMGTLFLRLMAETITTVLARHAA